jgi:hypothetical protein
MTAIASIRPTFDNIPDPIVGLIGRCVEQPAPYLCVSKRFKKQTLETYCGRNDLASRMLGPGGNRVFHRICTNEKWQKSITALDLGKAKCPDIGVVQEIAALFPKLQEISFFNFWHYLPEDLFHLKQLSLRKLDIETNFFTQATLHQLVTIKTIQHLRIGLRNMPLGAYRPAETTALEQLQPLHLKSLCLDGRLITDQLLEQISMLDSLEKLSLHNCQNISKVGLQHIQKLKNLQEFELSYTNQNDDYIYNRYDQLSNMKELRRLKLTKTYLSDESLYHICSPLLHLQEIIVDDGLIRALSFKNIIWIQPLRKCYLELLKQDIASMIQASLNAIKNLPEAIQDPKSFVQAIFDAIWNAIISFLNNIFIK